MGGIFSYRNTSMWCLSHFILFLFVVFVGICTSLKARALADRDLLLFGTIDTFLIWRLSGGEVALTFFL